MTKSKGKVKHATPVTAFVPFLRVHVQFAILCQVPCSLIQTILRPYLLHCEHIRFIQKKV